MKKFGWLFVLFIFLFCPMQVVAEGYTKEQYEQWQEDGTWEERVAFMEELENSRHRKREPMIVKSNGESWNDLSDWRETYASMPSTGEVRALVFLVEFQDMKNTESEYTAENVQEQLFGQTDNWTVTYGKYKGSLTDYYQESSFEQLTIDGDVYGWYTASGKRSDYADGANGREKLLKEVLEYYDGQIDYSQYDSDNNGYIDALYLNYAGGTDDWGEQWWNYQTDWYGLEGDLELDNKIPQGYVFWGQKFIDNEQVNIDYTTTAIHETGHLLGLPDFYDYDFGVGEGGGLGGADMMDLNVGDHNPFSKLMLGWIDKKRIQIVELEEAFNEYNMTPFSEGGNILIVANNWTGSYCSEYYLIDYYTDANLNTGLINTDGGLRIWHVNAELNEYNTDFVYDNSYTTYKLLKLYEADGKETISATGLFAAIYVSDEDLYHYGDVLNYGSYPNSDYYGKRFTGIHIQVGKQTDQNYSVLVKRDATNPDEPKIVNVTPEPGGNSIFKDGLYKDRWIEIEFENSFSIADTEKISVITLSGKEAAIGGFEIGEKKIVFPLYGDSTTKAIIKIEPGFVCNSAGLTNSWTYSFEINSMMKQVTEDESLATLQYNVFSAVTGTCYDEEKDVVYAAVSCLNNELYWVSVDSNHEMKRIKLSDSAPFYYVSAPIKFRDDVYLIGYKGESACDILFFKSDGTILYKYTSKSDVASERFFSYPMVMPDGSICVLKADNYLNYYKIWVDGEYQVTENVYQLTGFKLGEEFPERWGQINDRIYGTSVESRSTKEECLDDTTQTIWFWEVDDKATTIRDIVLDKEQGFYPFKMSYILEEDDSYLLFGESQGGQVSGETYKKVKFEVIRLNKKDYSVIDHYEILEEKTWYEGARDAHIVNVVKRNEDEYILQITCDIMQNSLSFTPYRPTKFLIGLDGSFNKMWVQLTSDSNEKSMVIHKNKDIFYLAHDVNSFNQGYYKLAMPEKQKVSFVISNNLSDEVITSEVVANGQLRYCIPQVEGYTYSVFVNGKEIQAIGNVLVCDAVSDETSENVVQIIYAGGKVPARGVVLDKTNLELEMTGTYTLTAKVRPESATNKEVAWTSSNEAVATVDANGKVTAVNVGSAVITATAQDGSGVSQSCTVIVCIEKGNPFYDVYGNQWYYKFVKNAYDKGFMAGKGKDEATGLVVFQPIANMARAEFVQVLYNMEGKQEVEYTERFTDIPSGAWYTNAVLWAAKNDITSGNPDGRFGKYDNITREQLALMLMKYAKLKGYDVTGVADLSGYADTAKVSSWAEGAISWAVANGIITGTGDGRLDPQGSATRAEATTMLCKFYERYNN